VREEGEEEEAVRMIVMRRRIVMQMKMRRRLRPQPAGKEDVMKAVGLLYCCYVQPACAGAYSRVRYREHCCAAA
jgi:hypothetical protein